MKKLAITLSYTLLYLWMTAFASTLVFGLPLETVSDTNLQENLQMAALTCVVGIIGIYFWKWFEDFKPSPVSSICAFALATVSGIAYLIIVHSTAVQRGTLVELLRISATSLIILTLVLLASETYKQVSHRVREENN